MSRCLYLSGFDLKRMRPLLGSGDALALDRLTAELAEHDEVTDEVRCDSEAVLRRAVREGIPFPDLEVEGKAHVLAADVLACHGQSLLEPDSSRWEGAALPALRRRLSEKLPPGARAILAALCQGTPLFGREFRASGSYYAYFSLPKVEALAAALQGVR